MGRDRQGIQGKGTQHIVGAVVAAGFVDRQNLDGMEAVLGCPLDHLGERLGIANTKIMPSTQREERNKNSRDFFIRIEIHISWKGRLFSLCQLESEALSMQG